jgi:hypothetical protein
VNTIDPSLAALSQRLPPSNMQAEQALLGALLANNKAYERVSEFLAPEHFVDPIHGLIYAAISRRVEAGQLACVAVFLPLAHGLRRTAFYRRVFVPAGSALIAVLAAAWLVDRVGNLGRMPF